jgi:hypothetical protein
MFCFDTNIRKKKDKINIKLRYLLIREWGNKIN